MKKLLFKVVIVSCLLLLASFTGCASCERELKSCNSDIAGGLQRTVNVYSYTGELIATHEGLIDIDDNSNGSVMFDLNGKRYVYYNAIVQIIEK